MRYLVAALSATALGFGLLSLRDATLSTHQHVDPGSRIELVARVSQHRAEPGQTKREMFDALLAYCRLEVTSDPSGAVEELEAGTFRAVLRPSMDATNRRQFRGCLEDWTADSVRVDVIRLDALG